MLILSQMHIPIQIGFILVVLVVLVVLVALVALVVFVVLLLRCVESNRRR